MTHKSTYYQVIKPNDSCMLGYVSYDSIEQALEMTNYQVERAKSNGYHNDEKWLFVKVDVTKMFDDSTGYFLGEISSREVVGFYDNGKFTR